MGGSERRLRKSRKGATVERGLAEVANQAALSHDKAGLGEGDAAMAMNKVRITVLKTTFDKELADKCGVAGAEACPMLVEGQEFYADYSKPEGSYPDWVRVPRLAIASCNDGIRPVVFKTEMTDIPAEIDFKPLR